MLSRTASELYWLSRYLERAENTARMLDVAWNMSLIPRSTQTTEEIAAPLTITGSREAYDAQFDSLNMGDVLYFFTFNDKYSGSIYNCLKLARENAHAVRGKITMEMWESINAAWLEMKAMASEGFAGIGVSEFFEWVKNCSHLFRGATYGTVMRSDAFRFLRIGTFIERADNTARILDVRHQIRDRAGDVAVDYYRWNALLRSVGAFEAYREMYADSISAENIAELLIFRAEVPRSLRSCVETICDLLTQVEGDSGINVKRIAAVQNARLQYGDMAHVLEIGLHAYLEDFLRRINEVGEMIRAEYLEVT
ncbi:MAG: alpha-E domain-containing protein [Alcanivoracaceae bacterium]|nr:alpha-E domain-containing protein [Alcanivoracaceae bacterium]